MLWVRKDTFDAVNLQFRVEYIENPRPAGFTWLDIRGKKWQRRYDRPGGEAQFCCMCKRHATATMLGRPRRGYYGLMCPECKVASEQQVMVRPKVEVPQRVVQPVKIEAAQPQDVEIEQTVTIQESVTVTTETILRRKAPIERKSNRVPISQLVSKPMRRSIVEDWEDAKSEEAEKVR